MAKIEPLPLAIHMATMEQYAEGRTEVPDCPEGNLPDAYEAAIMHLEKPRSQWCEEIESSLVAMEQYAEGRTEVPDCPEGNLPDAYELRDAIMHPEMPLSEWREELECRVQHCGHKIMASEDVYEGYKQWYKALQRLPKTARPRDAYALAPEGILVHLGY